MEVQSLDQNFLKGMNSRRPTISTSRARCGQDICPCTKTKQQWLNPMASLIFASLLNAVGEAVQLPPLSMQYADFAYWQRQWMAQAK